MGNERTCLAHQPRRQARNRRSFCRRGRGEANGPNHRNNDLSEQQPSKAWLYPITPPPKVSGRKSHRGPPHTANPKIADPQYRKRDRGVWKQTFHVDRKIHGASGRVLVGFTCECQLLASCSVGVISPNTAFWSADYADYADVEGHAPFKSGKKPSQLGTASSSVNLRNLRNLRTTIAAFGFRSGIERGLRFAIAALSYSTFDHILATQKSCHRNMEIIVSAR